MEKELDKSYTKIIAGLPFEPLFETLDAVAENKMNGQTIVDCKARICKIKSKMAVFYAGSNRNERR